MPPFVPPKTESIHRRAAFTLVEMVIAIAIVATTFGGIIVAYTQTARRAQWSGLSLAAQALSIQQIEQARSATWDPAQNGLNQITNLILLSRSTSGETVTGYTTNILDVPYSGENYIWATNFVTLRPITTGPTRVWMVKVDTVWPFIWGSSRKLFTNTVSTYCAPDNRDSSTLFN